MISIKPGAKIKGIKAEMLLGLAVIEGVFEKYGFEVVLTEGTGAHHMVGSLHYEGLAVDLRSQHILGDAIKYKILSDCVHSLGDDFDMILENIKTSTEHFHCEFQPKD